MLKYWPWIRFRRDVNGRVFDWRWVWTPITYRFSHGGWVYLSPSWFWRFRQGIVSTRPKSVDKSRTVQP